MRITDNTVESFLPCNIPLCRVTHTMCSGHIKNILFISKLNTFQLQNRKKAQRSPNISLTHTHFINYIDEHLARPRPRSLAFPSRRFHKLYVRNKSTGRRRGAKNIVAPQFSTFLHYVTCISIYIL